MSKKKNKEIELPVFEVDLELGELQKAAQELLNDPDRLAKALQESQKWAEENLPNLFKEPEPMVKVDEPTCDHGVFFDEEEFNKNPGMSAAEVQRRWPRGWGPCPKGCGFSGIAYASYLHYIAGDW